MSKNKSLLLGFLAIFGALLYNALNKELVTYENDKVNGISGQIFADNRASYHITKTDNGYVMLVDPKTNTIAALKILNPFLTPMAFYIGQADALNGRTLKGSYHMLVVTDKNGSLEKSGVGELTGGISNLVSIGTQGYQYTLNANYSNMRSLGIMPSDLNKNTVIKNDNY